MPVKSYGFAIGNLRAKEKALLSKNDMLQLASAPDTDRLCAMMKDKGVGYDAHTVPELLREDTEKLWKYIKDNAPDMEVFAPFIYENDFHNYKAVLKAVISGREYANLLILPALTDVSKMEQAVKEKRFDLLPDYMRQTAEDAYDVLAKDSDPQLCDCIIDAGRMAAQLKKAKDGKNKVITDLITVSVFYGNIKAALRSARTEKSSLFLDSVLTETQVISKKALIGAALSGEDAVIKLLEKTTEMGGNEAAAAYKKSPGNFEKFVDDKILNTAKKCKFITIGVEPIVGYMLARQAEIKDLQIIYSGVKTGQPREKSVERLRELYE